MRSTLPPRPPPDERPVAESRIVLWVLGLLVMAGALSLAPLLPTHRECKLLYEERIRYSQAPQLSTGEASFLRYWAVKDGCPVCENTGRVSMVYYLKTHDWNIWASCR